jgi:SAM-dependent methyltransferase
MFSLDTWQLTLLIVMGLLVLNYIVMNYLVSTRIATDLDDADTNEGFSGSGVVDGSSGSSGSNSSMEEFSNDTLYDSFYSKIYDQIVSGETRVRAEVLFTLGWMKKIQPDTKSLAVLDIGCGTGGHVEEFKKEGVGSVLGIDRSAAMVERAQKLYPGNKYMVGDVVTPTLFSAGEFNLVTMYYFTIYYLPQKEQILRNLFTWMKPGSGLVIHVVNRDKFDPILESASPFLAFSVQKYAKERKTKSMVAFDKFDYTAEFNNDEHHAEFVETFKFKDGRRRRHKHSLHMPVMERLTEEIEAAGFVFKEFIDLTPVGYEYQFLFCFAR